MPSESASRTSPESADGTSGAKGLLRGASCPAKRASLRMIPPPPTLSPSVAGGVPSASSVDKGQWATEGGARAPAKERTRGPQSLAALGCLAAKAVRAGGRSSKRRMETNGDREEAQQPLVEREAADLHDDDIIPSNCKRLGSFSFPSLVPQLAPSSRPTVAQPSPSLCAQRTPRAPVCLGSVARKGTATPLAVLPPLRQEREEEKRQWRGTTSSVRIREYKVTFGPKRTREMAGAEPSLPCTLLATKCLLQTVAR